MSNRMSTELSTTACRRCAIFAMSSSISAVVRYRLAEEGRVFIAEDRMESERYSQTNTWVFERQ